MISYETPYRVCYADTDRMGIMYYGNYPRLYEIGRTDMIRTIWDLCSTKAAKCLKQNWPELAELAEFKGGREERWICLTLCQFAGEKWSFEEEK